VFWLLGAPDWAEAMRAGGLFGTKLVLNEFVAFIELGQVTDLSQRHRRGRHLRAVRLRQFQLDRDPDGGDRQPGPQPAPADRRLGIKALVAGSLSNLMSAALAGLFLSL
jgi:CNT family concentrative nucleoside transporter